MTLIKRLSATIIIALFLGSLATPLAAQEPTTEHVVQAGENLFRIGLQYGFTADQLALHNGLSDPTRIYEGQVISIPLPIGGGEELTSNAGESPFSGASASLDSAPETDDNSSEPDSATDDAAEVDAPAPEPVAEEASESNTGGPVIHIVQANEGLSNIARAYGVNWTSIAQVNNISNPDIIYAGQELVIPDPTLTPPANYGQPVGAPATDRYIVVELSAQRIQAFQGDTLMRESIVSTGLPGTPTVLGEYAIYSKLVEQTMYGPGYYLPGVQWVMYFYQGYAIHGTYWHNNFGQPMSHGCVNLPNDEARWFFEFAQIGTPVYVTP